MLGTHDLPLFILSGLLLNLTPGVDSLYIATRSISQGPRAGMVAALGINAGCLVHVLAAALGLSAVLAASSTAFTVVKALGAAYLIYIGWTLLRSRAGMIAADRAAPAAPLHTVFAQGFLTNLLNPKVALFFLAFVPQFIEPGASNKPLAFVLLGAIFVVNSTLWCLLLAWATAWIRGFRTEAGFMRWFNRGVGALFVALGVRLAFTS